MVKGKGNVKGKGKGKESESWYDWLFGSQGNQTGGGSCTLCGSPGTTRATCPLNPKAKNPNPEKHSSSAGKKKVAAAKVVPRNPVGSRGCVAQTTKKYQTRKSPAFPANECCGETMEGKDGLYISRETSAGYCRWFKVKN